MTADPGLEALANLLGVDPSALNVPARTPEEIAAEEARDAEWRAKCDERDRKAAVEAANRARFEAIARSGIPVDRATGIAICKRKYDRTRAVAAVLGFLENDDHRILFLAGGVGTGKTYAGAVAISECGAGRFSRASRLRHELYPASFEEAPAPLNWGGVWVVDDLGTEDAGDPRWASAWFDFVDARQFFGKTIITTNLAPADLRRRYGPRVSDRLRQCARIVVCTGESIRKTAKGWEP